jgi:major membrane immunogen (membrane-anchored lipoprotein)
MKKEAIFAALAAAGLAGKLTASSSDKEFEQHLEELFGKAKRTDTLENELKEFKETQAEALISAALKSGKITNAEKDEWIKDATQNYALVAKSLKECPANLIPMRG